VGGHILHGELGYTGNVSQQVSSASPYNQALSALALFGTLSVIVAAISHATMPSRGSRPTLIALLLAQLSIGLASGDKTAFLLPLISVLVVQCGVGRFPRKWILAGLALFVVVVVPFAATYRQTVRTGTHSLGVGDATRSAPAVLQSVIQPTHLVTTAQDSTAYLGARLREIDNVAIIMQRTPSGIPFAGTKEVLKAPLIGVIPRAVWPGKPLLTTGYQFNQEYYNAPATVFSSSAVTSTGDLYRHDGLLAVLVGMAGIGLLIRVMDDVLHPLVDLRRALYFVPLLQVFIGQEDGIVSLIAGLPYLLTVSTIGVWLAFRSDPLSPTQRPSARSAAIS
jgi:hypothetical protein